MTLVVVVVVVAVAIGWWIVRRASAPRTAPVAMAPAPPDSLADVPPYDAYRRALALGERTSFVESLPYFRRSLSDPPNAWQPYAAYATALFQATHQVRSHRGFVQPATRSSFERVHLLADAGVELEQAARLAAAPKDRAYVYSLRMKHLTVWDLDWDAYAEFSRAEKLDPSIRLEGDAIGAKLRHPTAGDRDR